MGASDSQRGLRDSFSSQAPSLPVSHTIYLGSSCSSSSHSGFTGKGGSRKGSSARFTGLLQPHFLGPQEDGRLAPGDRSVNSEFVHRRQIVQNGDYGFYPRFHSALSLGGVIGSHRRVFSRPDPPQVQEISPILAWFGGFPVQGIAVRHFYGSTSLHKTHGSCGRTSASARVSSTPVLRRLAASSARSPKTSTGFRKKLARDSFSRSSPQPSKVRVSTIPELHVCWDELSHSRGKDQDSSLKSCQFDQSGSDFLRSVEGSSSGISLSSGSSQCCSRSGGIRTLTPSSSPVLPSVTLEAQSRQFVGLDSSRPVSPSTSTMVVGSCSPSGRGFTDPSQTGAPAHYRCEPLRLGGSPRTSWVHDIGNLVASGFSTPHQQFGDEGSASGTRGFSGTCARSDSTTVDRQHNCGGVCEETRGNSLFDSLPGDSSPVHFVSGTTSHLSSQTHPRSAQCISRQPVQTWPTSSFGVVTSSGSGQSDLLRAGPSDGGPVCHSTQSSAPPVCVSCTRPGSLGSRCSDSGLGSADSIRFPTIQPSSASASEGSNILLPAPVSGSLVASTSMVQQPDGAPLRPSSGSAPQTRSAKSKRCHSQQPRHVPSTRLAVIRRALQKKRFSSRASLFIESARRQSTRTVYDAKWKVFSQWCLRRKVNPLDPSPRRLADFLVFLFDERKLSVSTIKGYRSMISHTLSFRHRSSVCSDPMISELIRGFELKRPVSRSLTPKWDLACVLWSLTKTPYEPLEQASLTFLTWKTVFLLTLASAKRRSEIHALSVEDGHIRFNAADGSVTLLCQSGFLAKTQLPSVAPTAFTIPSLARTCGQDDPDRLLCPVRALRFYLSRVKSLRGRRKRLFIPVKGGGGGRVCGVYL